ncbi:30S ribosomal protein S4 [Pajaroellobacter abortibovis]|uniref:Small ribosomal subunit protein uS4 n=1 Tax=Pajaroellobacter abortibovis TaxID=1882918 RepID=A0A1L6MXT4_9BACT|nr:30S ribosomal protein S4 [Pajaroellobacter abortibovis]APS00411.1 30S ribosomal protein S4 [Pajaroellobacter abortibovis]
MARYTGPVCRLCRREGIKLFLKGERCFTEKCSVTRRPYPPGQHGQARVKLSEYAIRLREKQKMRSIYGIVEKQFQKYYLTATRKKGRTGEQMFALVESRLDNVVYRLGFTATRAQARQLVLHKHFLVNGKLVNIPSYMLSPGDKVELQEKSRKVPEVNAALAQVEKRPSLSWLELDKDSYTGVFKGLPVRDEINEPTIREQYIVEYYSR